MVLLEYLSIYVFGGIGYGSLEILWRGRTHWTMIVTGGVCSVLMYLIATRSREPLWKKWIMSAAVISAAEFAVGCIVNLKLGWNVWDYSAMPLNLMGQICPRFSFVWLCLSIPGIFISQLIKKYVFPEISK